MTGAFSTASVPDVTPFALYQGGNSNYTQVTLNLPSTARVRHDEQPSIHVKTDVNVLLDGTNKIKLSDNITGGMALIISGANLANIAVNTQQMFVGYLIYCRFLWIKIFIFIFV
jgi:hypothetical protein